MRAQDKLLGEGKYFSTDAIVTAKSQVGPALHSFQYYFCMLLRPSW